MTSPSSRPFRIIRAAGPVRDEDIRELRAVLSSPAATNEMVLHELLRARPALVWALGFVTFVSEVPLIKRDGVGEMLRRDARRRDRADIVAAEESVVLHSDGRPALFPHLIELKGLRDPIAARSEGTQLREIVSKAIGQLHDYADVLRNVDANRPILEALGCQMVRPRKMLIMGMAEEFRGRSYQFAEIRGQIAQQGVELMLWDDLLRVVEERRGESRLLATVVAEAPDRPLIVCTPQLVRAPPMMETLSVAAKYLFQVDEDEQVLVERAVREMQLDKSYAGTLFEFIWGDAKQGASNRTEIVARGRALVARFNLEKAWDRWCASGYASDAPREPYRRSNVLWGYTCRCGHEIDLDPDTARRIVSFKCAKCGTRINAV